MEKGKKFYIPANLFSEANGCFEHGFNEHEMKVGVYINADSGDLEYITDNFDDGDVFYEVSIVRRVELNVESRISLIELTIDPNGK